MMRTEYLSVRSPEGLRLLGLGFLTLFLELSLIRYLAGNIWNLGYFPNLVLLAVFIGMGLGFIFHHYFGERCSRRLFQAVAVVIFLLAGLVVVDRPALPLVGRWERQIGGELYFSSAAPSTSDTKLLPFLLVFLLVIVAYLLLSQRTAKYFRRFAPLTAYTLDITGSCLGILAFMLISWRQAPAYLWFTVVAVVYAATMEGSWKTRLLPAALLAAVIGITWQQDRRPMDAPDFAGEFEAIWSPYQKLEYKDDPQAVGKPILANGLGHQVIATEEIIRSLYYQKPYNDRRKHPDLPPYRRVLIIGAGSGNDVAAALHNGAELVDAVEIDPAIAQLGIRHHPCRPYQDQRVRLTIDDGRAFMTNAKERYDLIVYALTDSLVKVSSLAQLRLENYLFTKESAARAYSLLTDNGNIVFYNYYRQPWLVNKIREMIFAATGKLPEVNLLSGRDDELLFTMLRVGKAEAGDDPQREPRVLTTVATDDWPFLYLRYRGIPPLYRNALIALGSGVLGLVLLLHFLTRRREGGQGLRLLPIKLAFVFMGTAFLLLETKSVIQFSLLFGTTWLNNSLVFLGVLVLVLAANWTAVILKSRKLIPLVYLLLLCSCLLPLGYPLSNLLAVESPALRYGAAALLVFSPIFFANLIFSLVFREQPAHEHVFGWNLIGSTIGGLLEYTSMLLGYNRLAIIVAVCYTLVFIMLLLGGRAGTEKAAG